MQDGTTQREPLRWARVESRFRFRDKQGTKVGFSYADLVLLELEGGVGVAAFFVSPAGLDSAGLDSAGFEAGASLLAADL